MSTLEQLKIERRQKGREARTIMRGITDETPEAVARRQERRFDALMSEIDELDERIDEIESRALDRPDPRRPSVTGEAPGVADGGDSAHRDAFCNWLRAPHSRNAQAELSGFETRSGNTLTGAAGGFLVPEQIAGPILSRARDANPLRGVVRVVPVSSGDVVFPLSDGNAASGWVGETDARTATTEPTLAGKVPTFGISYAYVKMTEEMAADGIIDVADWFQREAGGALGEAEMAAIMSGNGTNKPSGMLRVAPESGADGSRTADAFKFLPAAGTSAVLADEMLELVYDLKAAYRANGRWLMNSATAGAVRKLKDNNGGYLWQDRLTEAQPNTFAGYPVTICEAMEDLGPENHPIAFGDFEAGYILAQRSGITVTVDDNITEPGFTKLYIRHRIGGCVYDENAVRFLKNAAA